MQVAFVVKLDLDDDSTVDQEAQHIEEVLTAEGLPVSEVKPWQRDTIAAIQQLIPQVNPPSL